MLESLRNWRNEFDFFFRNKLNWHWPIDPSKPIHPKALKLQSEFEDFLNLFDWKPLLENRAEKILHIADVGARTFAFAPVFDRFFRNLGFEPEVHGIEIDAFRRFTNFHSRFDYGQYYASLIPKGYYYAQDFLTWDKPVDLVFLLHPFVTKEPLLHWGLPLSRLTPNDLFQHSAKLTQKSQGFLMVSSPTRSEFRISQHLAKSSGFREIEYAEWQPHELGIQELHRFGSIFG